MGISWDNRHNSSKTWDKRKPYHKKQKYELGRPAANTKIGPRIHTVGVRGGNKKYQALRLDVGNFSWGSECSSRASCWPALHQEQDSVAEQMVMC
ncbi:40S ribosomal protein S8 [Sciurus carolinensis]|uniref:40S ribosomal protein S8 n=1 Tax=Sciurus carolinensis TaxID=30640 RepID=A0AA41MYW3_SCICA|nr:40S ribosomal protein S8 [Sciurus carolinensis]